MCDPRSSLYQSFDSHDIRISYQSSTNLLFDRTPLDLRLVSNLKPQGLFTNDHGLAASRNGRRPQQLIQIFLDHGRSLESQGENANCLRVSCRIDLQFASLFHAVEHISRRHRCHLINHVAQKVSIDDESIRSQWEIRFDPRVGLVRWLERPRPANLIADFSPPALILLTWSSKVHDMLRPWIPQVNPEAPSRTSQKSRGRPRYHRSISAKLWFGLWHPSSTFSDSQKLSCLC